MVRITLADAQKIIKVFFDAYLVQRDIEATLACLMEEIQWIGTGKNEVVHGYEQARIALQEEFAQDGEHYRLEWTDIQGRVISDDCAMLRCEMNVLRPVSSGWLSVLQLRVSACCIQTVMGCRIASLHASMPSEVQAEDEYYPIAFIEEEGQRLLGEFAPKTLELLGKSIPGGIMSGYVEPEFPLYYINEQMLQYLGYDYESFVASIDGKVINGIHPDDREWVTKAVMDAFSRGEDYEVRYRMLKCDGSYIYVNDIGKQIEAAEGRQVCLSVVRDISAEVEADEKLRQENLEKLRQAQRYDELMRSALCGIVQYNMEADGSLIFKNANREAIRIFGYEPEEFWAKEVWQISDIVVAEDCSRIFERADRVKLVGYSQPVEYRILQKNGESCWVMGSASTVTDDDGSVLIQSVYMDIDSKKQVETQNLQLSEQIEAYNEALRLALEHTSTCEFYYYPMQRRCTVPPRTCQHYQCESEYANMPESFAEAFVLPEYHNSFLKMFEEIHQGSPMATCEIQMIGDKWCRGTLSVVGYMAGKMPEAVVGLMEDITSEKTMAMALEEAKSRDGLTGLWNKEAGLRLVQAYIADKPIDEHCVMMLLDMDDFKQINEEEGTAFANAVLQEVADILRAETKLGDYCIRLGGDEFMLLLKDCDKAKATVIGPQIALQVQNLLLRTDKKISISVSIGMCSTEVVNEYSGLYRCAESTLKYIKANSKGQAACYLDTSNELGVMLTNLYTEQHVVNVVEQESSQRGEDLISFALDLLGKAKNLEDAVFLLLARLGKTYQLDRVSFLEIDPEYLSCRFAFQWARNQENIHMNEIFYLSSEEYEAAAKGYDAEGLSISCINKNISPNASCLHTAIWNHGMYVGAMGFELDQPDYLWTAEQRHLLAELGKIVPSFVMKARADAVSRAKTDFLSRMSHEIRTPMNAIVGMTAIARSVADDKEKVLECLDKLEASNQYLLNLINDILDMSRIESGKMELNCTEMDLVMMVTSLEGMFRQQAKEKRITLVVNNEYHMKRLLIGDKLRLEQVLTNILSNALKFTDEGGRVVLRITPVKSDEQSVCLHFSVMDNGIGIAPGVLDNIFNAFEQAEKSTAVKYGGTGLGLAISSQLVQMMGGALRVRSELGKGSVFFFDLEFPFGAENHQEQEETPAEEIFDFDGKRLLLVEDNDLNREIAQTILEMYGFLVETAINGQEALDQFQQRPAYYFDGVLMDIRMPVLDGIEATKRLRTMGRPDSRTIPILAMTANAFDEDSRKSLESGMNGHLAKPIQVTELLKMLQSNLA